MPRKNTPPERIIAILRQIEVLLGEGSNIAQACREAGIASKAITAGARSTAD